MASRPSAPISIRRRLLLFLACALLLTVVGAAIVTHRVALKSANDAYDRSLLDPAFDIAENIKIDATGGRVDLPPKALEALVYDQLDRVIFQVRSDSGEVIAGEPDLPPSPKIVASNHLFFNGVHDGEPVRLVALRAANGYVVQVGETLHKRNRLVTEILLAELAPTLLISAVALGLAWLGVARGLRPLEHMRAHLMARHPGDLRPIPPTAAPIEIHPVVDAFNNLIDQLRDASTLQRRFLANAAHQLRTPLAGLQMHLDLLLRNDLSPSVVSEVNRMHDATVRASRLANQLLSLAKAESPVERGTVDDTVDLMAVADAAARNWTRRAIAQQIDLGFAISPSSVPGDPLLIPELLDNLIDNALQYTPPGGAVTVSCGERDGMPYVSVEDTGPGIPEAERGKVCERFYRVAGTSGYGSGLGLAIVKEIADRHSATVNIAEGEGGEGTRVLVVFPRSMGITLADRVNA